MSKLIFILLFFSTFSFADTTDRYMDKIFKEINHVLLSRAPVIKDNLFTYHNGDFFFGDCIIIDDIKKNEPKAPKVFYSVKHQKKVEQWIPLLNKYTVRNYWMVTL